VMMIPEASRLSGHASVHNILTTYLINLIARQFRMGLYSGTSNLSLFLAQVLFCLALDPINLKNEIIAGRLNAEM
jgi:hypothetical protein